jgi:hypothetical protein
MTNAVIGDLRAEERREAADAAEQRAAAEQVIREVICGSPGRKPPEISAALQVAGVSIDELELRIDQNNRRWNALRTVRPEAMIEVSVQFDDERTSWGLAQVRWEVVGRFIDPGQTRRQLEVALEASDELLVAEADKKKLARFVLAVKTALAAMPAQDAIRRKICEAQIMRTRVELMLTRPLRDMTQDAGLQSSFAQSTEALISLGSELEIAQKQMLARMLEVHAARAELPQLAG